MNFDKVVLEILWPPKCRFEKNSIKVEKIKILKDFNKKTSLN